MIMYPHRLCGDNFINLSMKFKKVESCDLMYVCSAFLRNPPFNDATLVVGFVGWENYRSHELTLFFLTFFVICPPLAKSSIKPNHWSDWSGPTESNCLTMTTTPQLSQQYLLQPTTRRLGYCWLESPLHPSQLSEGEQRKWKSPWRWKGKCNRPAGGTGAEWTQMLSCLSSVEPA